MSSIQVLTPWPLIRVGTVTDGGNGWDTGFVLPPPPVSVRKEGEMATPCCQTTSGNGGRSFDETLEAKIWRIVFLGCYPSGFTSSETLLVSLLQG